MSRVELEFAGNSRGAVTAGTEAADSIKKVKQTAVESANATVQARARERRALQEQIAEYRKIAQAAKSGSDEQIAANRLVAESARKLGVVEGQTARHVSASEKELSRFTKGAVVGSGVLGRLSRTVALASGGFLGGLGFIAVMKGAVSAGGGLQKQLERTTKVFGSQAGEIKDWSKTSATALGLARTDALDAANSIQTLLKNMDVAPPKATAMSKTITQLASDMAAFKGVKPEVALAALEAGLQGRTRSLKQFGIVLDQATIKQEAERLGLVKSTVDLGKVKDAELAVAIARQKATDAAAKHGPKSVEEAAALLRVDKAERALAAAQAGHAEKLTNEQKALATYNLLMKQTADQQGTWKRRSHDLAGQEQILHAQVKDLQEELGTALIPQLTKYLPMLTGWIDRNEKNGTFQRDFNKAAKDTGAVIGTVVGVVKTAKHLFDLLGETVGGDKHLVELLGGSFLAFKAGGLAVSAVKDTIGILGKIGAVAEKAAAKVALIGAAATTDAEEVTAAAATIETDNAAIAASAETAAAAEAGIGAGAAASAGAGVGAVIVGGAIATGGAVGLLSALFGQGDTQLASVNGGVLVFTHGKFIFRQRGESAPVDAQQAFDMLSQSDARLTKKGRQALDKLLGQQGAPAAANDELAAKLTHAAAASGGKVSGVSGPVTPGLAMLEKLVGGHVNDDFATGGHAPHSYHYLGEAADLAPDPTVWAKLLAHKEAFAELFSPWGLYHFGVQFYDAKILADHSGAHAHIHVAFTGTPTMLDSIFKGAAGTTAATGTAAVAAATVVPAGGFVEIPKYHKVHLTPLQRAIASGQKSIADDVAQINDDVAKGALPASLATYLEQRAKQIQKALQSATDPAKIKVQVGDFRKLMQDALRLPVDAARMQKDIATWQRAVKEGLLPAGLEHDLERRALVINAKLAKDLNNPRAFKADEAALHQIEQTANLYMTAFKDAIADRSKLARIGSDFQTSLADALGHTPTVSLAELGRQKADLDNIMSQLSNPKGLSSGQIAALQRRFDVLAQTYQSGLGQLVNQVSDAKSKLEADWQRMETAELSQFDQETQDHLAAMQEAAQKAVEKIQVTVQGAGFASFLFGGGIDQTPTEKLIAGLEAQRQEQSDAQAVADAQAQLAADQAGGGSADQILADQKALDDALYQQKIDQLQKTAALERDAATQQLQAAQDAYTKREQTAEQAYQRERDGLRQHIEDMFTDTLAGIEAGTIPLSAAFSMLGDALGGTLSAAFIAQIEAAYLALQALANGANPGSPNATATSSTLAATGQGGEPPPRRGYARGGWAGHGSPMIDARDTILARLRPGEYVMSPEEVAAGGPRWAGRGNTYVISMRGATLVGAPTRAAADEWARHMQGALDRLGTGMKVSRF